MQVIGPVNVKAWNAKEVVKEVNGKPHLLVRLELQGDYFPSRAIVPMVRIVTDRGAENAWFTEESPDQRSLIAYFRPGVPAGVIECAYGSEPAVRAPTVLDPTKIARLDPKRLPQGIVAGGNDVARGRRDAKRRSSSS